MVKKYNDFNINESKSESKTEAEEEFNKKKRELFSKVIALKEDYEIFMCGMKPKRELNNPIKELSNMSYNITKYEKITDKFIEYMETEDIDGFNIFKKNFPERYKEYLIDKDLGKFNI